MLAESGNTPAAAPALRIAEARVEFDTDGVRPADISPA